MSVHTYDLIDHPLRTYEANDGIMPYSSSTRPVACGGAVFDGSVGSYPEAALTEMADVRTTSVM